ncbi:BRO family protein [Paramicrobacterium agarici]|uniref:BRO family protein n=1 Tax=Paramicrobacterium agarici TaxID=630514 RepID=UPI0011528E3F|nr:BRO family protein [Microbacterium agarici]TQO23830.1 phage antirepressor protein KilAC domain-containing protein [Microbacterium agarici]
MSAVDIFQYSGQQVRTVIVDGEAWFVAADVCRILEHSNPSMAVASLDDDEKGLRNVETPGGAQSLMAVNEPGLYSLILRSRKPEAKQFKRWVTHEVLPQIRQTGAYGSQLPGSFAEALELAAAEVRQREALEAKVAEDAPKVAAYDQLMDADGFYTMEAVAKLGGIGRTTLFRRLREAGVIQSGSRLPYQRYMHWFKITASSWTDAEGIVHPSNTARVLPQSLTKVLAKAGITVAQPELVTS